MPTAPGAHAAPRPQPRGPWRAVALLTAVVGVAHLLLLGLLPTAAGPGQAPTETRFTTRTIVAAPPQPTPAPPAAPAPSPAPHKPRPRPAPKPRPAPVAIAPTATPPEIATETPEAATAETTPGDPAATDSPTTPGTDGAPQASPAVPPEPAAPAALPEAQPPAAPVPVRIPGSMRLKFAVSGQQGVTPLQGVFGELSWQQDGHAYDAQLSLTFFFKTLRSQHSEGVIGPTGIEPTRFSDKRKVEVASHFARDQGTVVFSNNAPSVPLLPGAQDRLSVVLQLGALMAADPARYPTGSALAMQTVGPRDADIWSFVVGDEEELALPAGHITARRLVRTARRPYDDTVEVWVAPALGYAPVRIKQTQANGDFADMQLREQLPSRPGD
ncbi:DUF3108 domain-containing protein [Variovorax ginsengisoli]|uniref:DUF3108 domain-containing protein n=1 Tax=Variovorax ginsengisoli TaxID=363844 RepID=A0ABT9SA53_9BURK|nr:DUF3108 domain-containing protein [Variovorax ginsengisoli]MDP9901243.1 hypothetical protein [Variovorax ginsengisoli]